MKLPNRILVLVLAVGLAGLVTGAGPEEQAGPSGNARLFSTMLGVSSVQAQRVFVHVVVGVEPGRDPREVAVAALREQGARPADPRDLVQSRYTLTGFQWDQFSDADPTNNLVTLRYNPNGQRASGTQTALQNAATTWTNVTTSAFALSYGATTNVCPTLVKECSGPQYFNGVNEVGWKNLAPITTLAVTWFGTSPSGVDETDMGFNSNKFWKWHADSAAPPAGWIDVETVGLHEKGHVAGLGHTGVEGAIMEPSYEGMRRTLSADDIAGVSFLYP